MVVLHPDELHDGRAGDGGWFHYKAIYVAPAMLQEVINGRPLPFVPGGVSDDIRLKRVVAALLDVFDHPLEESELEDTIFDLAAALEALGGFGSTLRAFNRIAVMRARSYIDAHLETGFSLTELERETGHQRWQLSRDFRSLLGTSPYRYLIARRLDKARRMLAKGQSTEASALACGFADQSHFGRAFKRTFGLTPGVWSHASSHNRSIRNCYPSRKMNA